LVDYSQDPLDSDRALVEGVDQAELAVRAIDHDVVVIGESMGSMVASRLAAELAGSSDPPAREDIRFVLMASPEEGVAKYFKVGTFIPVLNYKISRVAESPYATTVVIGEYDGWADPPDRPWNLVALANSVLGILYVHGPAIRPRRRAVGEHHRRRQRHHPSGADRESSAGSAVSRFRHS
jgi:pimeloyl-ACP methyl ester carboxylesterase